MWDALTKAIEANAFANNDVVKSIIYLSRGAKGLNSYLNKNVEGYKDLTMAEKKTIIEQQKLNAQMLDTKLKTAALALAITFLIGRLDEYSERQKKLYQDQLDLESEKADKALTNSNTLEDDNATLEEQINKYKELKKSLMEEKHTLSEQITLKGQIYDIQKSIVDKYGEQASGLDLVNGKLDTEIEKLTEIERINAKTYLEENSASIASSESALTRDYYSGNKQSGDWPTIQLKSFKRASQVGKAIAADLYGEYIEGFSDFVGNIFTQYEDYAFKFSGTAEEVRASLERSLELLNNEAWISQFDLTEDEIKATKTAIEKEISEIDEFIKKHQEVLNKAAQARALTEEKYRGEYGKFLEAEKAYAKAVADGDEEGIKKAEEDIAAFQTFVEGITDDPIMKNFFLNLLDGWKEQLQNSKIDEQIQNTTWKIETALKHLNGLNLNADALRNLAKIYSSGDWDLNAYGEETYNAIWEIAKAANAAGVDLETFINRLETLGLIQPGAAKATQDATNKITKLSSEIETLKEEIETLSGAYDTLEGALSEYNENGYIALDTLMSLLDLEPKYLKYLFDENGRIKNNIDGLNDLAQARLQEIKAKAIQTAYEEMAIVIANNDADTINKLKEKYGLLEDQLKDTGTAYEELAKNAAKYKAIEGVSDENKTLIDAIVQNVENQFAAIDKLWNKTLSSGSKSSSSSSKSTKEWWETVLEDLKNQFKYNEITVEEYIKGLGTLLGQVEEGTDAWRQINEEFQKQRLSKVEDDYKRGTIGLEEYIKKLKELIKAYKQGTDAWNELADKIKSALQDLAEKQEDALETAKDAATTIIDEEIDRLKALQEAEEERYDKLIAEKEKANEETERELELAKLQEALENAKKEKTKRVWREGLGKKLAEYKDNYIGQMLEIVKTEVRLNLRWCVYG